MSWNILVPDISIPGDFNDDGNIDAADYVLWRKNDGTEAGYNAWRAHFGTAGSGSSSVAGLDRESWHAAPEPAAATSALVAVIACLLYWRNANGRSTTGERATRPPTATTSYLAP